MLCNQCGMSIENGSAFCPNCGAKQIKTNAHNAEPEIEKTVSVFNGIPGVHPTPPMTITPTVKTATASKSSVDFVTNSAAVFAPQESKAVEDESEIEKTVGAFQTVPPVSTKRTASSNSTERATQPVASAQTVVASKTSNKVGFGEAVKLFFKNYVNFKGRASKSEYWWAFLFYVLVCVCTIWIPVIGEIVILALLLPTISIAVRRLHDSGKSGAAYFLSFIPFAGSIILMVMCCKPSDGDNCWGPGPNTVAVNTVKQVVTSKAVTDADIYAMVYKHEPTHLDTPESKVIMDRALGKIIPTYTGLEDVAGAIMLCDPHAIKSSIAVTDTDTLMIIFKALGYYIGHGSDANVLGMIQQNVLAVLKIRI